MPGTSTGPPRADRSGGLRVVAPTTTPTEPGSPGFALWLALLLITAAWSTISCATVRSSNRACCTVAPSGLEDAATTNTPRSCAAAVSSSGRSEPNPRYGDAVTASAASGESPAQAAA